MMLKREWFQIVNEVPPVVNRVRYWNRHGVGAKLSIDKDGIVYIEDIRLADGDIVGLIRQTAEFDKIQDDGKFVIWIERDAGSAGMEAAEWILKSLKGFEAYHQHVTGSNEARSLPLASHAKAGYVRLLAANASELFDKLFDMRVLPTITGAFNKLTQSRSEPNRVAEDTNLKPEKSNFPELSWGHARTFLESLRETAAEVLMQSVIGFPREVPEGNRALPTDNDLVKVGLYFRELSFAISKPAIDRFNERKAKERETAEKQREDAIQKAHDDYSKGKISKNAYRDYLGLPPIG